MKLLKKDLKKGEVKVEVENLNDLWYLSQVVDSGDRISGKTLRKFKIGDEDRNAKVVRKPVHMAITAEKIDFSRTSNVLRITGPISEGPEDVSLGTYHSFNVEEGTRITIAKEGWLSFQLDKIDDAVKATDSKILMIVLDREEAYFAMLEKYGYRFLTSIKGDVQKKDVEQKAGGNLYKDVLEVLAEYDKRYGLTKIVVGSPSFWKEEFLESVPDDVRKRIVLATCSAVGKKSFDELLRRDEVNKALKDERISQEVATVERLLAEISKAGLCAYGLDEVRSAADAGAVDQLMVTDSYIWKMREEERYPELDNVLKSVDKNKGRILIVSHEHEAGQKLDGVGGIGALLRYRVA